MKIYFKSDQEVICFCEHLFRNHNEMELNWKSHKEWGNELQFKAQEFNDGVNDSIVKAMVYLYMKKRLSIMIKKVIKTYFYYSNTDEINRILNLTEWIVVGKDKESLRLRKGEDPEQLLFQLFHANIKQKVAIHFDSIIQFRLQVFEDQMIHYVGLAIDEYKREEDHQLFVHLVREYIEKKSAVLEEIHILQGETFTFYNKHGKCFSKKEIKKVLYKEPLYIVGLDDNEYNLAPLVALAPKNIYIYGDDPAEPKTLTVINIFQERACVKPLQQFPFSYYVHRNH